MLLSVARFCVFKFFIFEIYVDLDNILKLPTVSL